MAWLSRSVCKDLKAAAEWLARSSEQESPLPKREVHFVGNGSTFQIIHDTAQQSLTLLRFVDGSRTDAIMHDGAHRVLVKFGPAAVRRLEKSSGILILDLTQGATIKLHKYSLIVRNQVAHDDCIQLRVNECDLGKPNIRNSLSVQALPLLDDDQYVRRNLSALAEPPRSQTRVIDLDDDDDVASYVADAPSQVSNPLTQAHFATQLPAPKLMRRPSADLTVARGINLGPPLQPPVAKGSVNSAPNPRHADLLALLVQNANQGLGPAPPALMQSPIIVVKHEEVRHPPSSATEPPASQREAVLLRGETVMVDVEDLAGSEDKSELSQHDENVDNDDTDIHVNSPQFANLDSAAESLHEDTEMQSEQAGGDIPGNDPAESHSESSSGSGNDEDVTFEPPTKARDPGTVSLVGFDFVRLYSCREKPVSEDQRILLAKKDSNHYQAGVTPFSGALIPIKLLDRLSNEVDRPLVPDTKRTEASTNREIEMPDVEAQVEPMMRVAQSSQAISEAESHYEWPSSPVREAPRYESLLPPESSPTGPPPAIRRRPFADNNDPRELPPDSSAAISVENISRRTSIAKPLSHPESQDPRDTLAILQIRGPRRASSQLHPPFDVSASAVPIKLATSHQASLPSDSDSSDIEMETPRALPHTTSAKTSSEPSTNLPLAQTGSSQTRQPQQRLPASVQPSPSIPQRSTPRSQEASQSSQQPLSSSQHPTRSVLPPAPSSMVMPESPQPFTTPASAPTRSSAASKHMRPHKPSPETLVPGTFSSGVLQSFRRASPISGLDGVMDMDDIQHDARSSTSTRKDLSSTQQSSHTHQSGVKRPAMVETSLVRNESLSKRQKSNNFDWDRPSQVEDPVEMGKRMKQEFLEKRKNSRPAVTAGNETPTSAQAMPPPEREVKPVSKDSVAGEKFLSNSNEDRDDARIHATSLSSPRINVPQIPGLGLLNNIMSIPRPDEGTMPITSSPRHLNNMPRSRNATPQQYTQPRFHEQSSISASRVTDAAGSSPSVRLEPTLQSSRVSLVQPIAPPSSMATQDNASRIHNLFKQAYPAYTGDVRHFLGLCRNIKTLQDGSRLLHRSLWDDFIIRHKTDYSAYVVRCIHEGEAAKSYETYYQDEIEEPLYTSRVINPKTLEEVLRSQQPVAAAPTPAPVLHEAARTASSIRSRPVSEAQAFVESSQGHSSSNASPAYAMQEPRSVDATSAPQKRAPQNRYTPRPHVQEMLQAVQRTAAMKDLREDSVLATARTVASSPFNADVTPSSRAQNQEKPSRPTSSHSLQSIADRHTQIRAEPSVSLRQSIHRGTLSADHTTRSTRSPMILDNAVNADPTLISNSGGPKTVSVNSSSEIKSPVTDTLRTVNTKLVEKARESPAALPNRASTNTSTSYNKLKGIVATAPEQASPMPSAAFVRSQPNASQNSSGIIQRKSTPTAANSTGSKMVTMPPSIAPLQTISKTSTEPTSSTLRAISVRSRPDPSATLLYPTSKSITSDPSSGCHACGSLDHFFRECPLRHARMLAMEDATPSSAASARARAAPVTRKRDANYDPADELDIDPKATSQARKPFESTPAGAPPRKDVRSTMSAGTKNNAARPAEKALPKSSAPVRSGPRLNVPPQATAPVAPHSTQEPPGIQSVQPSSHIPLNAGIPGRIPTGPAAGVPKPSAFRRSTYQQPGPVKPRKDAAYDSSPSPDFAPAPPPQKSHAPTSNAPTSSIPPSQNKRKLPLESLSHSLPPAKRHAPSAPFEIPGLTEAPPQGPRASQAQQAGFQPTRSAVPVSEQPQSASQPRAAPIAQSRRVVQPSQSSSAAAATAEPRHVAQSPQPLFSPVNGGGRGSAQGSSLQQGQHWWQDEDTPFNEFTRSFLGARTWPHDLGQTSANGFRVGEERVQGMFGRVGGGVDPLAWRW